VERIELIEKWKAFYPLTAAKKDLYSFARILENTSVRNPHFSKLAMILALNFTTLNSGKVYTRSQKNSKVVAEASVDSLASSEGLQSFSKMFQVNTIGLSINHIFVERFLKDGEYFFIASVRY